jgi:hypothetical protein
VRCARVRHPVLDRGRGRVEHHDAEGVGQRLLVPACAEPGVPAWGRGGLLLWSGQEAGRRVETRCGHEGLQTLLSNGHGAGVHSHVPLPRVAACRRNQWGRWSGQKSHYGLCRYCGFYCCSCSGCHRCRRFHHWAGETAWKTVAWPSGTQRWCRAPSGQPEARYCPCESPSVADRPEL